MNAPQKSNKIAVIIIMGVSGSGKTTIGKLLAQSLNWQFEDADDFHSQANKAKMHSGIPLTDEDRKPWLEGLADHINDWVKQNKPTVLACSALKESYRELLTGNKNEVAVVYLRADYDAIAKRLQSRTNHFMNKGLLESQFATLEEPAPDKIAPGTSKAVTATADSALTMDATEQPDNIVATVKSAFGL